MTAKKNILLVEKLGEYWLVLNEPAPLGASNP
jgi:hypothetical protein